MIAIVVMLGFGVVGYLVAKSKGRQPMLWAVICALFPLIGLIILAFLRPELTTTSESPSYDLIAYPAASTQTATPIAALPKREGKERAYDGKKWAALVEIDQDIAEAAAKVRAVGDRYVDQLAETYLTLNDKSYLSSVVDKVLERARDDLRKHEALAADAAERTATFAGENAALVEQRRRFADAARASIKARGGIDDASGKRVVAASVYTGPVAQWAGSLKLEFADRSLELRKSESMRMYFTDANDFTANERRIG
jgi:hypothetical protein